MRSIYLLLKSREEPGIAELNRAFGSAATLVRDQAEGQFVGAFDTFDWRFLSRGELILDDGERFRRYSIEDDRPIDEWRNGDGPPTEVVGVAGVRAILPVARWQRSYHTFRLTDDQSKTIGRVTSYVVSGDTGLFALRIDPLRGYDGACDRTVREARERFQSSLLTGSEAVFTSLLSSGGRPAGAYQTAVSLRLSPEMPPREGYQELLDYFLSTVEETTPGVIGAWDSEFLHDYRVALRRLRSATSQMKKVMPSGLGATLSAELKALFQPTGRARDLDVLLLSRQEYIALLPPALVKGVALYFDRVEEERARAYEALRSKLTSPEHDARLARLRSAANQSRPSDGEWDETKPLGARVQRWTKKRVSRVEGELEKLESSGSEAAYHALRIECKKLRYLLEIFASLFRSKQLRSMTKALKRFQDALGANQDLVVQQELLSGTLKQLRAGMSPAQEVQVAASIGGLLAELHRREPDLKAALRSETRRFKKIVPELRVLKTVGEVK